MKIKNILKIIARYFFVFLLNVISFFSCFYIFKFVVLSVYCYPKEYLLLNINKFKYYFPLIILAVILMFLFLFFNVIVAKFILKKITFFASKKLQTFLKILLIFCFVIALIFNCLSIQYLTFDSFIPDSDRIIWLYKEYKFLFNDLQKKLKDNDDMIISYEEYVYFSNNYLLKINKSDDIFFFRELFANKSLNHISSYKENEKQILEFYFGFNENEKKYFSTEDEYLCMLVFYEDSNKFSNNNKAFQIDNNWGIVYL